MGKALLNPKMWSSPRILQRGSSIKPVQGAVCGHGPGMRHLAKPTRWKVQVAAVYLVLQRAVAHPERRPSIFPLQEAPWESLNNRQWSGLWFIALLDGKPLLTPRLLQLFPGYKWHLLTSRPPKSSCPYPPDPCASWKLARSRKISLNLGIKTCMGFLSLV